MKVSRRLIDITGMRDIVQRRIPIVSMDSGLPGPIVWLTACIHGDEVGGTIVVHDILSALRKSGLRRGAVHAFPLINSMGFENGSRFINADREDLNRCFPGDLRGSVGEQIARRLFDTVLKSSPDLVIDLHNDWVRSVPYILVEPPADYPSSKLQQQTLRMARAAGLLLVEDADVFHPLHNTLAGASIDAGIPAFTIEAGGGYAIVDESVVATMNAVLSILQALEMLDGALTPRGDVVEAPILRYTSLPMCTTSGVIRFSVAPGQQIRSKQLLARVYSAFGSCEESLRARAAGYVLGLSDQACALPGREVIAIAERQAAKDSA